MRILFCDRIQQSNAPDALKSPALSDAFTVDGKLTVNFSGVERRYDCIGIGYTDGSYFRVNQGQNIAFTGNGLYMLPFMTGSTDLEIETDATYIGRLGLGRAMSIPTSPRKEFSYRSTGESRTTLGGQVVFGMGGYEYRTVSLDSRYQVTEDTINEIWEGYGAIGKGYPFFINLEDEAHKLPFDRLYAIERDQKNMSFESGINRFLYSRRWNFDERF